MLYFEAASDLGAGFWKSDGTAAGTVMVYPNIGNLRYLTAVNGTLFFSAGDGTQGWELWKSDGTTAGTRLSKISILTQTTPCPKS